MKKLISGLLPVVLMAPVISPVYSQSIEEITRIDEGLYESIFEHIDSQDMDDDGNLVMTVTGKRNGILGHNETRVIYKKITEKTPEIRLNVLENDFKENTNISVSQKIYENGEAEELEWGMDAVELLHKKLDEIQLEGKTPEEIGDQFPRFSTLPKLSRVLTVDPMDIETEEELERLTTGVDPVYFKSDEEIQAFREELAWIGEELPEMFDAYHEEWKKRGRITQEDFDAGIYARLDDYGLKGGVLKNNGELIIPADFHESGVYSIPYALHNEGVGMMRFVTITIFPNDGKKEIDAHIVKLIEEAEKKINELNNKEALIQEIDKMIAVLPSLPEANDQGDDNGIYYDLETGEYYANSTEAEVEILKKFAESWKNIEPKKLTDIEYYEKVRENLQALEKAKAEISELDEAEVNEKEWKEKVLAILGTLKTAYQNNDTTTDTTDNSGNNSTTTTTTTTTTTETNSSITLEDILKKIQNNSLENKDVVHLATLAAAYNSLKLDAVEKEKELLKKEIEAIRAEIQKDEKFLETAEAKNILKNISNSIVKIEEERKKHCEKCTTPPPPPPSTGIGGLPLPPPKTEDTPPTPPAPTPTEFNFEFTSAPESEFKKYPTLLPATWVRTPIIHNDLVETKLNKNVLRLAGSSELNIDFWKQVLPVEDRDASQILVIPSEGLVIPVNTVSPDNWMYKSFINGNNENFYKYLIDGSVELPGSKNIKYGEVGNKVIAGHSSYWKQSRSKYKTHFQTVIGLEENKEIWMYVKNSSGKYDRYVYNVSESYETSADDVSVLDHSSESEITLITCTPIGGIQGRWVVKAKFSHKE